ncbi:hypothetical protein BKA70DRAFT_1193514 [Coprinopsis sp. MPI-PUGE-AT-0042]|nr:hypothetical protein BKA70DRAFT_1193514 [Coprinopsis sp. MPI-PUGE-AT-0042]
MAPERQGDDRTTSSPTLDTSPGQTCPNGTHKPTGQLVWLITGTSSGLGLRLVASVLARGDRVIATARSSSKLPTFDTLRDTNRPRRIPDEYAQNLVTLQLDITSGEACLRQKVSEAASHWGRIDVLVNNAGLSFPGLLEEGGSSMLRAVFETNFFSTVDMTTATLPYIRVSKGWVVNVGSRSVWKAGTPGIGPYFTSKAALHAYTTTLAIELESFGVKVVLVAPGAMRTEGMYGGGWFGWKPQEESSSLDGPDSSTNNSVVLPSSRVETTASPSSDQDQFNSSPQLLEEYTSLRSQAQQRYASIGGTEPGDPAKAMEVLVDYVRMEGAFAPRGESNLVNMSLTPTLYNPPTLVLGSQSLADVRAYCEELLGVVNSLNRYGCGGELDFD